MKRAVAYVVRRNSRGSLRIAAVTTRRRQSTAQETLPTRSVARLEALSARSPAYLELLDRFESRHIGPSEADQSKMLAVLGFDTLEDLVTSTVPKSIRLEDAMELTNDAMSESEALATLRTMAEKNQVLKSLIGLGYHETATPKVILRNMLENPGWYTAYTPYQAEISQGRLEMLLNYQTVVTELTRLPVANASLLDEATAAAEAMSMCVGLSKNGKKGSAPTFFVDHGCHPQTISVVKTRCDSVGVNLIVGDASTAVMPETTVGVLFQYPDTRGIVRADAAELCSKAATMGALSVVAADPLALTLLEAPGTFGANIAVGSMQRFGVPMGFGGPHAAYMATNEKFARRMPGRIIGETIEQSERKGRALRMAMQTREQHIRRDKATSNICTAQALLANMAAAYAIYHGADGLKAVASRCRTMAAATSNMLRDHGFQATENPHFDTVVVSGLANAKATQQAAIVAGYNVRVLSDSEIAMSFGETLTTADLEALLRGAFGINASATDLESKAAETTPIPVKLRTDDILQHAVFNAHRSETQMLRYLRMLEGKDLALNHSMISLGSCTMKLNATSEMIPVTWPQFCNMHPFAPVDQTTGYVEMIESLSTDLAKITGFHSVSVQPNSGASGEYAGLLAIREYQKVRGEQHRDICLIPLSAHGTNPASAVMAGLRVVTVKSDASGNIDFADFEAKAKQHADKLSAIMITYPSTYGVFEEAVQDVCRVAHDCGGQVYMDGANLNAQCGLTNPFVCGADVCHLNLHKTFCIPHGGGGPGVGAIGVAEHLTPHLPSHDVVPPSSGVSGPPVAAATYGSAAILPITWMYIKMLGAQGLARASAVAILNANYLAKRLEGEFAILFRGANGQCAHEFIVDLRDYKKCGVSEEDVAKRLQDYGFHSPTMSWPVPGTLMIEPTESEDLRELDRFADAMLAIRQEIRDVETGNVAYEDSPLKHAPHTMRDISADTWNRVYSRNTAAFPLPGIRENKFWPTVNRVDNVHGDRHLVCTCAPVEAYAED